MKAKSAVVDRGKEGINAGSRKGAEVRVES